MELFQKVGRGKHFNKGPYLWEGRNERLQEKKNVNWELGKSWGEPPWVLTDFLWKNSSLVHGTGTLGQMSSWCVHRFMGKTKGVKQAVTSHCDMGRDSIESGCWRELQRGPDCPTVSLFSYQSVAWGQDNIWRSDALSECWRLKKSRPGIYTRGETVQKVEQKVQRPEAKETVVPPEQWGPFFVARTRVWGGQGERQARELGRDKVMIVCVSLEECVPNGQPQGAFVQVTDMYCILPASLLCSCCPVVHFHREQEGAWEHVDWTVTVPGLKPFSGFPMVFGVRAKTYKPSPCLTTAFPFSCIHTPHLANGMFSTTFS